MTNDFLAYWAAAQLLLNNGNAFSPAEVLRVQRPAGWTESMPLLMYNPPWTLPLVLPFGLLDYDTAQFLWFLLHSVIIFTGAQLLWRLYAGSPTLSRVGWLALLTFAPIYFVLLIGQIGPLVLAGLIGFLLAARKKAWLRAGAWLGLASIKPHLLFLLWIAALLWVLRERQWRLGAGFLSIFVILVGVPMLLDAQIYTSYMRVMSDHTVIVPMDWANPTIGMAVNALFGSNSMWLRWLPSVGGILWLLRHWQKNATRWDWSVDLPLVLLVSIVTTPYSWTFDYVVLLPALIQGAVWLSKAVSRQRAHWISVIYFVICAILLLGKFLVRNDFWYFWVAPTFLVLYVWLREDGKAIGTQSKTIAR